jgi:hypothetical protein
MTDEPVQQRKYTVAEIDNMRRWFSHSYPSRETYDVKERADEIERRLRTYMLNGTDPAELEQMARECFASDLIRYFDADGSYVDILGADWEAYCSGEVVTSYGQSNNASGSFHRLEGPNDA